LASTPFTGEQWSCTDGELTEEMHFCQVPKRLGMLGVMNRGADMSDEQDPEDGALGGIWATRPVAEQPALSLEAWRVIRCRLPDLEGLTHHLVGWCIENQEGRVTSPVREVDLASRSVTTDSGRRFFLVGQPRRCMDVDYVLNWWLKYQAAMEASDVTEAFLSQIGWAADDHAR
jgi:hypothetical protein